MLVMSCGRLRLELENGISGRQQPRLRVWNRRLTMIKAVKRNLQIRDSQAGGLLPSDPSSETAYP